jgi:hypothetical protein
VVGPASAVTGQYFFAGAGAPPAKVPLATPSLVAASLAAAVVTLRSALCQPALVGLVVRPSEGHHTTLKATGLASCLGVPQWRATYTILTYGVLLTQQLYSACGSHDGIGTVNYQTSCRPM